MLTFNKKKARSFFLIGALLLISGSPLIISGVFIDEEVLMVIVFIISLFFFVNRKLVYDRYFFYLLFALSFVTLIQSSNFNFFPLKTFIGLLVKIFIGYFIVKVLKKDFQYYYVKFFYGISLLSLFFYILHFIDPSLFSSIWTDVTFSATSPKRYSILGLFTFYPRFVERNSGPFWEAGVFGGYLVIAFIFAFLSNFEKKRKILFLLGLTIITTLSTTAYIALSIFLLFFFFKNRMNPLLKLVVLIFFLLAIYFAFTKLDFIGNKITEQYTTALDQGLESEDSQRFLSLLRDLDDFKGHEFFGRGWSDVTRFDVNNGQQIRTVGLTDVIVKVGALFFILMTLYMYKSFRSLCWFFNYINPFYSIALILVIFILLMSETYFNLPLFWSLLFFQFNYKNNFFKLTQTSISA